MTVRTTDIEREIPNAPATEPEPHLSEVSVWHRIRQATGTVYGDIGTSVLYTITEITRETVILKHHHPGHEQAAALVLAGGDLLTRNEIMAV